MKNLGRLFDNMDRWRNLPAYQLERRADIFFSIYLPEILSARFGVTVDSILPEFPIVKGAIGFTKGQNLSYKADYLAVASEARVAFLVELKTDSSSRRETQDSYLTSAQKAGLPILLSAFRGVYWETKAKKKYRHLLVELEAMGLILLNRDSLFEVAAVLPELRVVYVQPHGRDEESAIISFDQVASIVGRNDDALSARFAQSLRRWASVKAGEA